MKREFYVIRQVSSKDKSKTYLALMCDLGYRSIAVSFDTAVIAEISGITFADLYNLEIDKPYIL